IGSDPNGNALADGRNLDVPQGVTVMIDEGAVFKMRRGTLSGGSSTPTPSGDRSGGALRVLRTQVPNVVFTSFNADSFSGDTNASTTLARPGDWGGLSFHNDIDNGSQRFNYEHQGIFLHYVSQADI